MFVCLHKRVYINAVGADPAEALRYCTTTHYFSWHSQNSVQLYQQFWRRPPFLLIEQKHHGRTGKTSCISTTVQRRDWPRACAPGGTCHADQREPAAKYRVPRSVNYIWRVPSGFGVPSLPQQRTDEDYVSDWPTDLARCGCPLPIRSILGLLPDPILCRLLLGCCP